MDIYKKEIKIRSNNKHKIRYSSNPTGATKVRNNLNLNDLVNLD